MAWLVTVVYVAIALISGWWVLIALPVIIAVGVIVWVYTSSRLRGEV